MKGSRTSPILVFWAGALFAQTLGLWAQNPQASPTPAPAPLSPVIWTENPEVVQRFAVNPDAVREMVNGALLKLTSAQEIGAAWKRLGITPQDVVGIKITTMGGPLLSTHRALVQAICDGLQAAGVSPSHIIIWDKFASDMRRAGYIPTTGSDDHVGIAAIFPGTGYDPNVIYKNEQIGTLIWGDYDFIRNDSNGDLFAEARDAVNNDKTYGNGNLSGDLLNGGSSIPQTSNQSYCARLVTRTCTKIINVPVLTDNPYIGINGCLGSLALACVDNNRRFQGDPTYGDPAICEILNKEFLQRKVVVHILDALVAEYAGGPQFDPQFTQSIGALYVSRDPVAIDSRVLPRLEEWRKQGHVDPIGKMASHVKTAAFYNLGTDDPRRIQLIRLP
jgi:hypothetical protein